MRLAFSRSSPLSAPVMAKTSTPKIYRPTKEEYYIAFAEAVDAWSEVEWNMLLLFHSVNTPGEWYKSAELLTSVIGFRTQRVMRGVRDVHTRRKRDDEGAGSHRNEGCP